MCHFWIRSLLPGLRDCYPWRRARGRWWRGSASFYISTGAQSEWHFDILNNSVLLLCILSIYIDYTAQNEDSKTDVKTLEITKQQKGDRLAATSTRLIILFSIRSITVQSLCWQKSSSEQNTSSSSSESKDPSETPIHPTITPKTYPIYLLRKLCSSHPSLLPQITATENRCLLSVSHLSLLNSPSVIHILLVLSLSLSHMFTSS